MKLWFSLALVLATLTGCFSKDDPKASPDLPTTATDIDAAQNAVFLKTDPTLIQKGQFVYTLRTQELYSSQEPLENLLEEEALTVTDREDFAQYFDVTVVTEKIDYLDKDKPHYKFKNVYSIGYDEAPTSNTPASAVNDKQDFLKLRASELIKAMADAPTASVEFYNLKVKEDKKYPPAKVLEHTDCEGAACLINVTTLNYDVVVKEVGQPDQKNLFEVWLSADVPYFATVLKSCITTMVAVDTARPVVRQCTSVYDYRFTEESPETEEPVPPTP